MTTNHQLVIDGDGHVVEDLQAIIKRMPLPYRNKYGTHTFFDPFPPLDHLHSANLHDFPPDAFRTVGPDGWFDFLAYRGGQGSGPLPQRPEVLQARPDGCVSGCRIDSHWKPPSHPAEKGLITSIPGRPLKSPSFSV